MFLLFYSAHSEFTLKTSNQMFRVNSIFNVAILRSSALLTTSRSTPISLFHSSISALAVKAQKKAKNTNGSAIKQHIKRDRLREKKVANLIRKVTRPKATERILNKDDAQNKVPSFIVSILIV